MWLQEVELESRNIRLLPLRKEHSADLVKVASDGNLWDLWFTSVPNQETIDQYISTALDEASHGLSLPFVIIHKSNQNIIGSTRLCHADLVNHRVEIGYTWYSQSYQRTSCNTECKQLLLTHAFETLNAIAVEFRTSWHNQASRAAIARLGAKQDGVLRNHQKLEAGGYRDTVVFSILNSEWPAVKAALKYKLKKQN